MYTKYPLCVDQIWNVLFPSRLYVCCSCFGSLVLTLCLYNSLWKCFFCTLLLCPPASYPFFSPSFDVLFLLLFAIPAYVSFLTLCHGLAVPLIPRVSCLFSVCEFVWAWLSLPPAANQPAHLPPSTHQYVYALTLRTTSLPVWFMSILDPCLPRPASCQSVLQPTTQLSPSVLLHRELWISAPHPPLIIFSVNVIKPLQALPVRVLLLGPTLNST